MTGWLRAVGRGAARAASELLHRPRQSAVAIAVIATALVAIGMAQLAARNASELTHPWRGAEMIVYLQHGSSGDRAQEIGAALASTRGVERVEYVTPEMALTRLRGALGEHDELVEGLEVGMFPASLEVSLGDGMREVAAAHPLMARLRAAPDVDQVEIAGGWVERSSAALGLLRRALWFVLLFVSIAGMFAVAFTLRQQARSYRREDAVLRLVGASDAFVIGPRVLGGAVQGLIGAALGAAALWLIFRGLGGAIEDSLAAAFGAVALSFLPVGQLLALIGAGAALGAAGAWATADRHA